MIARNLVKVFRSLADLSQQQLAEMIGREPNWVSRVERRVVGATPANQQRVAHALGMPVEVVFPSNLDDLTQATVSAAVVPAPVLISCAALGKVRARLQLRRRTVLVLTFVHVTLVVDEEARGGSKIPVAAFKADTEEARALAAIVARRPMHRVIFREESALSAPKRIRGAFVGKT